MTRRDVNEYPTLVQEAAWLSDRIAVMRAKIDAPTAAQITGQPGAHNAGSGSKQERLADEYMDNAPRYEAMLKDVRARICRIEEAVDGLPSRERMVTRWHCFERLSYKYIADTMDISISLVSMIQTSAYKLLEELEDEHER